MPKNVSHEARYSKMFADHPICANAWLSQVDDSYSRHKNWQQNRALESFQSRTEGQMVEKWSLIRE